jgi:hypothetical protein
MIVAGGCRRSERPLRPPPRASFYLIMTTMAAQFITVDFIITITSAASVGAKCLSRSPAIRFGPFDFRGEAYLMLVLGRRHNFDCNDAARGRA